MRRAARYIDAPRGEQKKQCKEQGNARNESIATKYLMIGERGKRARKRALKRRPRGDGRRGAA